MRVLTDDELNQLRSTRREITFSGAYPPRGSLRGWHEGSELIGYWTEGDSYVFAVDGEYLAISRGYLKEVLHDALAR